MRPYYLDGDLLREPSLAHPDGDISHRSVIPVYIGYCAVFKVREEARTHDLQDSAEAQCPAGDAPVSQNSTACSALRTGSWLPNNAPFQVRSTFLVRMHCWHW